MNSRLRLTQSVESWPFNGSGCRRSGTHQSRLSLQCNPQRDGVMTLPVGMVWGTKGRSHELWPIYNSGQ